MHKEFVALRLNYSENVKGLSGTIILSNNREELVVASILLKQIKSFILFYFLCCVSNRIIRKK
jgi:hypothetical protein